MARWYEVTFRSTVNGDVRKVNGQGNTRRSAERHARNLLRDELGGVAGVTTTWTAIRHRHIPEPESQRSLARALAQDPR